MFMVFKYNIIIEEFNNFFNMVYDVLSSFKLCWNYLVLFEFVISVVIIIGKRK